MGILKGSLTYLRYRTQGELPSNYLESLEQSIEIRRFVPLHPEGEDTESTGWASAQRPFVDDEPLLNDQFLFGERIVLAYREDTIAFPKALMKDWVYQRIEKHQAQKGEEPSSETKRAIEATVKSELRQRILPKSKVVDVLFDLSTQEVRFFARGKGINERFVTLFEQTFQLKLKPLHFVEQATSADLSLRARGLLEALKPQEIFQLSYRTEVN